MKTSNPQIFTNLSSSRLLLLSAFYKSFGFGPFVNCVSSAMVSQNPALSPVRWLLRAVVRRTAFRLFCGGESLEECAQRVENIRKHYNLRAIVDYSTEEKYDVEDWNENLNIKLNMIRKASRLLDDSMSFVPLKCTAMMSPTVLEKLCKQTNDKCTDKTIELLSNEDRHIFDDGISRLRKLFHVARECQVPLLLDAEQSSRQPAIELIARILSQEFNAPNLPPVVYNTYQMYLKRTPDALHFDLQFAESRNYVFAAKIVRGAYMVAESNISKVAGTADPILPTKEDTDKAYDEVIDSMLNIIAVSRSAPVYVVLATHNQKSIELAMKLMKERGIHNSDPRIHFAQILGMADYCSNMLALGGYNVSKLISFGPFDELLPWLLRRLDENQDIKGAMQHERHAYLREFKRRHLGKNAS